MYRIDWKTKKSTVSNDLFKTTFSIIVRQLRIESSRYKPERYKNKERGAVDNVRVHGPTTNVASFPFRLVKRS